MSDPSMTPAQRSCPSCGGPATHSMGVEVFGYFDGERTVSLSAEVPVISCDRCRDQFTDWRGELARQKAVDDYLANREKGNRP